MNRIGKYILSINGGAYMGIHQLIIIIPIISMTITSPQINTSIDERVNGYYDYYIESNEETKVQEFFIEDSSPAGEVSQFNENSILLSQGIASEEVYRLKSFLKDMGYTGILEDYYYDKETKDLVREYQKNNRLVSDGIVGLDTYKSINNDLQIHKIILPEMKIEFNSKVPDSKWIMLNKTNNTLYYLKGTELIEKYPVATGKQMSLTPEGKFKIVIKLKNPAWGGAGRYEPVAGGAPNNPLGKRWMGLSVGGGGQYGIHGNSNSSSIGRFVSLGCIRMNNYDIESFYEQVDLGIPVWIGNEGKLEDFGIIFNME